MAYKSSVKWNKAIKGFTYALGNAGEHLTGWARDWMDEAVGQSISEIDADWDRGATKLSSKGNFQHFGGSRYYPWYTGQLHDSVVGVVSDRYRVVAIRHMPQAAFTPQTYKGQRVIGADWGERAALDQVRALHFVPGIRATIAVGVPYAEDVNEMPRHQGYIRELSSQFASKVEDYFTIKAGGFRTRVYVADTKKR